MRRWFLVTPVLVLTPILATACNLESAAPEATLTSPPALTATPIGASATVPPTDAPSPIPVILTPTARVVNGCVIPNGWVAYTVARGDTLYRIATRYNSNVAELTRGNCLTNANQISVDQTIYVPGEEPTPTVDPCAGRTSAECTLDGGGETGFLEIYLIALGDNGANGRPVGCDDSAILRATNRPVGDSVAENVQGMLEALLSTDTESTTEWGIVNALTGQDLAVREVVVEGDRLRIELVGELQLTGVCQDARMEAQFVLTAFHYLPINTAQIFVNGRNLRQIFDLSGLVGAEAIYTRSDVPGSGT